MDPASRIAIRYLRGKQRHGILSFGTWMSLAGVAIGVAATCLVTGVFNGFISRLSDVVVDKMGHFIVINQEGNIPHVADFIREAGDALPPGTVVEPLGWMPAMAAGRRAGQGINLEGLRDDAWEPMKRFVAGGAGDVAKPAPDGAWMGEMLAERLGLKPGDLFQVLVPAHASRGVFAKNRTFRLEKTITVGMQDYDGRVVIIQLPVMRQWLGWTEEASLLRIRLPDGGKNFDEINANLERKLGWPWVIKSWKRLHRNFFESVVIEKYFLSILVGVIVLVSQFNVISTLYLMVTEKIRDISILRSMGASRSFISRIFTVHGGMFGILGATAGIALAIVLAWVVRTWPIIKLPRDVYNLSHLPVDIRWTEWLMVWAITAFLAFVASLLPGMRASRLNPVEGIRHE